VIVESESSMAVWHDLPQNQSIRPTGRPDTVHRLAAPTRPELPGLSLNQNKANQNTKSPGRKHLTRSRLSGNGFVGCRARQSDAAMTDLAALATARQTLPEPVNAAAQVPRSVAGLT
jgi:hypothetical protein